MRARFGCRILCLMLVTWIAIPLRQAWPAGWEMVFSDEFNEGTLDRNKWATRYIYQNETLDHFNDENERYRDTQVKLSEGTLNLIAEKKVGSDYFESGMIRSHRTFYYGYYEARVFLPSGKGIWPAFWLEADYDQDGKTWHPPEIDIFEYVMNGAEDKPNMLHSNAAGPGSYTFVDGSFQTKYAEMFAKEDLGLGWHVAGLVWAPDRITLFWDGRRIYTRNYEWLRPDGKLGPPAHVDLNFAVGGKQWAGRHGVDEGAFPQTFKVDYVRVCQFTNSERGARTCGNSELTPAPEEFGYSSPLNDMPKPTFLKGATVGGRQSSNGDLPLSGADKQLDVAIPLKMPDAYPSNRTLQIAITDEATGAVVAFANRRLQEVTSEKRVDGTTTINLLLPSPQRPGNYRLDGKLTAEIPNEKGINEALSSPVTCETDVIQPPKARSCRLLSLHVTSH
jgi:beta-glucanase (GH16 family)